MTLFNKANYFLQRKMLNFGCRHMLVFSVTIYHFLLSLTLGTFCLKEQSIYFSLIVSSGIGALFGVGLLLRKYWTPKLERGFAVYWPFALTYSLSFSAIFTGMLFFHEDSTAPVLGIVHVLFCTLMLTSLVDFDLFLAINVIGVSLAVLVYKWLFNDFSRLFRTNHLFYLALYSYLVACVIGFFCFRKTKRQKAYLHDTLKVVGKEFLHHVSNALGTAKSHASLIEMCIKSAKIKQDKESGAVFIEMEGAVYTTFQDQLERLASAHETSQTAMRQRIASLLLNIQEKEFSRYAVAPCIQEALTIYEKINEPENNLPEVVLDNDFFFQGSDKHLIQILINLLAYSYTEQEQECNRKIWLEGNAIKYRYEGQGIPSSKLVGLFNYPDDPRQYKLSPCAGYGIGSLYYVRKVMEAFKGYVSCDTNNKPNHSYTCFTLTFPL